MPSFGSLDQIILWQDSALIAVNKPAGLLSLPDGYKQEEPYLQSLLEPEVGKLWIVHRLDRETSGVMILARSVEAHHSLNDQFAGRAVRKIYHALVHGKPDWEEIIIDEPLRKNGDRRHRTVIDRNRGKPAATSLRVLERFPTASLIEAQPHSGYTHQIRAHLAWAGCPLIADPLYNRSLSDENYPSKQKTASDNLEAALPIHRVALHALAITFRHPETGEQLTFRALYPADFSAALENLRRA